ncbi:hypothetical protein KVT40_007458 [Elsinoe batatas]|uniref:Uncharacterized protein n=1 Tax=Elsinoe batatas TaxID=2601811 RepID=A0A8K0PCB5_9PEZI|nr:hypothetical protein KVT40_007458 [Elsinoe batatas]
MSDPQTESALVNVLPAEIRHLIYIELFQATGLRQHILCHGLGTKALHFCRWPCSIEFEQDDGLQQQIEQVRQSRDMPWGKDLEGYQDEEFGRLSRHLKSPWLNHWACGDDAFEQCGLDALFGASTASHKCWKVGPKREDRMKDSSSYISMLLCCKVISAEFLAALYAETTFIFTDMQTLQAFFGSCELHPIMEEWPKLTLSPPPFFKHARKIEISLSPDFPSLLLCASHDLAGLPIRHSVYDFHWLRLAQFENLQSIKIWISARSICKNLEQKFEFKGIKQFTLPELKDVLDAFTGICSVEISAPLSNTWGPQEGRVEELSRPGLIVCKRGSGDHFHPFLTLITTRNSPRDKVIHTSQRREVRIGIPGGHYMVMHDFGEGPGFPLGSFSESICVRPW